MLHRTAAGETAAVEEYYAQLASGLTETDIQTQEISTEERHKILHELLEKAESNKQEVGKGSES